MICYKDKTFCASKVGKHTCGREITSQQIAESISMGLPVAYGNFCEPLTWPCEICGEVRPDEKIWVITYPLKDLPGGERNLKYCNDKKECMEAANKRSFEGKI